MDRGVNLIVGDVIELRTGALATPEATRAVQRLRSAARPSDPVFPQMTVVAMPLGDGASLVMMLSQSTPDLDRRIRDLGWERIDLHRREE